MSPTVATTKQITYASKRSNTDSGGASKNSRCFRRMHSPSHAPETANVCSLKNGKMLRRRPSSADQHDTAAMISIGQMSNFDNVTRAIVNDDCSVDASDNQLERHNRKTERNRFDKPCHHRADSLLSSTSGYNNYRGFFNLAILLLVLSNARVAIENMLKYGILVDPVQWLTVFLAEPYHWPNVILLVAVNIFIYFALMLEKHAALGAIKEQSIHLYCSLNLAAILTFPAVVVLWRKPTFILASAATLSVYTVVFLKLVSYKQMNSWYRNQRRKVVKRSQSEHCLTKLSSKFSNNEGHLVTYPNNLTFCDLWYFVMAPTLCYELNYPRLKRIRKWFLFKRSSEFVFLVLVILALCQQWIVPLLRNSVEPLTHMQIGHVIERLLKLSIPNHLIWLICFYCLFHSWLNLIGEFLRFGDREFYLDWWNSESIQRFWQTWNIPVHKWAVRHLYKPLVNHYGLNKTQASICVFLLSAFFHEYLISVPLCMFRLWAFMGMTAQVPLHMFCSRFLTGTGGNVVVWLSLILGQPLAILSYLHDYYVENFGMTL